MSNMKAVVRTSDNAVLAVATSPQMDLFTDPTTTIDLGPKWGWGTLLNGVTFDAAHPFASWFAWDGSKVVRK